METWRNRVQFLLLFLLSMKFKFILARRVEEKSCPDLTAPFRFFRSKFWPKTGWIAHWKIKGHNKKKWSESSSLSFFGIHLLRVPPSPKEKSVCGGSLEGWLTIHPFSQIWSNQSRKRKTRLSEVWRAPETKTDKKCWTFSCLLVWLMWQANLGRGPIKKANFPLLKSCCLFN